MLWACGIVGFRGNGSLGVSVSMDANCMRGERSIHNLGRVGHIEDIAVAKDQQGKKLGLRMIQALDYLAEKVGCYKVGCFAFILYSQIPIFPIVPH